MIIVNSPRRFSSVNFHENKATDERDPQAHGTEVKRILLLHFRITPGAVACATCPAVLVDLLWQRRAVRAKNTYTPAKCFLYPCLGEQVPGLHARANIEQHGHARSFFANQSDALRFILNEGIGASFERTFQKIAIMPFHQGCAQSTDVGWEGRCEHSSNQITIGWNKALLPVSPRLIWNSVSSCGRNCHKGANVPAHVPEMLPRVMIFQDTRRRRLSREQLSLPHTMPVPGADRNPVTILNQLPYRSVGFESYFTNTSCSEEKQLLCVI